jgi:carotenoid cleavage dioxygenase
MVEFGPATAVSEPVHVPSKTPGHDGWLIVEVDHEIDPGRHVSELLILDATDINAPPVARIKVPVALHPQIHGCWVPGAQLDQSRAR